MRKSEQYHSRVAGKGGDHSRLLLLTLLITLGCATPPQDLSYERSKPHSIPESNPELRRQNADLIALVEAVQVEPSLHLRVIKRYKGNADDVLTRVRSAQEPTERYWDLGTRAIVYLRKSGDAYYYEGYDSIAYVDGERVLDYHNKLRSPYSRFSRSLALSEYEKGLTSK